MTIKVMKHQNVSLKFMATRKRVFDMSDPGTGKTLVQIMDFAKQHKKDGKSMLVVCPKSLMRAAWANDIKKFAPHLRVSLAYAKNRAEALSADADVFVINVDGVKDLLKHKKAFWKRFGRVVIDESTAFKHHTSQRSKAMKKLVGHFEWRRLMSGTPTSNGICDLWHQMLLVDDGKRLGTSFFGFRNACCEPKQVGAHAHAIQWVDKEGIEQAVSALISDVVIRHKFEECVDIPANHMYSVPFELTPKHQKIYDELEEESIAILQNTQVSAVHGGALYTKLLQIASGAVYNDDGDYSTVASERYELVLDLVEQRRHSVVFYLWEHQLQELLAEAKKRKLPYAVWDPDKPGIADEYQKGLYQVLFAHPASAGHGLTLTKGTATIWASPTPNLEWFSQGKKRVHRIGQNQTTETIVVIAENTRDVKVFDSLMRKDVKMTSLLEDLKCSAL